MSLPYLRGILAVVIASTLLAACGGGGHSAPLAPTFTSTPPTAAEQAVLYTYQAAATDPSGGAVSFSLTAGPTGASLMGSSLNWTPTAAQSRVSNSFTITATTTSGGSAAQTWTVTPTGTITVSWIDTQWTASGSVPDPNTVPGVTVAALVPQADGSLTSVTGTQTGPGVWSILGIPAGYFWLTIPAKEAYWTSSSAIDVGRDLSGSTSTLSAPQATTFDLNLTSLEAASGSYVVFFTDTEGFPRVFPVPNGSTVLTASYTVNTVIDWTQVSAAFLTQYTPSVLGPFNTFVLGPAATLTNPGWTNGGTNDITTALQPTTGASIDVMVLGSQWPALFNNVAPSTVSPSGAGITIATQPFVVGANAKGIPSNLQLVTSDPAPGTITACNALPLQPPLLTDQNLGTLQYGDPFPAAWTRSLSFCQGGDVPIQIPNTNVTALVPVLNAFSVAPSSTPFAPMLGPVLNPTINGNSLFTASTLNTTAVTLNWTAPSVGTPFGYTLSVLVQSTVNGMPVFLSSGVFTTGKTSVTLPPLTAGSTYLFLLAARADAGANVETKPRRSVLPTAFADVVSAPITISSGAASAPIHGDARVVWNLSQPQDAVGRRGAPGASLR